MTNQDIDIIEENTIASPNFKSNQTHIETKNWVVKEFAKGRLGRAHMLLPRRILHSEKWQSFFHFTFQVNFFFSIVNMGQTCNSAAGVKFSKTELPKNLFKIQK